MGAAGKLELGGRAEAARLLGTGPGIGLCGKKVKDGQRGVRSGRAKGWSWERKRTQENAGAHGEGQCNGAALRTQAAFAAASSVRSHLRIQPGLAPTSPSHLCRARLGRGAAPRRESPSAHRPTRPCPRGPHLQLGSGALGVQSGAGSDGLRRGAKLGRGAAPSGPRGREPRRLP